MRLPQQPLLKVVPANDNSEQEKWKRKHQPSHSVLHNKAITSQISTPSSRCNAQMNGCSSSYRLRAQLHLKQRHLRVKTDICGWLTRPKIPFSLWRWTVISGLMKLLASMGMPIPRFAGGGFVKGSNHNLTASMRWKCYFYISSLPSHSPSLCLLLASSSNKLITFSVIKTVLFLEAARWRSGNQGCEFDPQAWSLSAWTASVCQLLPTVK